MKSYSQVYLSAVCNSNIFYSFLHWSCAPSYVLLVAIFALSIPVELPNAQTIEFEHFLTHEGGIFFLKFVIALMQWFHSLEFFIYSIMLMSSALLCSYLSFIYVNAPLAHQIDVESIVSESSQTA